MKELSKTRMPRPARTVIAPRTSGIAAAATERKTKSRTIISSGAASSSARSDARERFLLKGTRDCGESGLGRRYGRVDVGSEGAFERRHGVADHRGERPVEVDEDEGAIRTGAQGSGRGVFPGGDGGGGAVEAQRRDQARTLAVDRRRRAAQHDSEGHRFAEIGAGERFAAR